MHETVYSGLPAKAPAPPHYSMTCLIVILQLNSCTERTPCTFSIPAQFAVSCDQSPRRAPGLPLRKRQSQDQKHYGTFLPDKTFGAECHSSTYRNQDGLSHKYPLETSIWTTRSLFIGAYQLCPRLAYTPSVPWRSTIHLNHPIYRSLAI